MSVVAFWLVLITILEPAEQLTRDSRQFVSRVEAIRQEQNLPLVFYREKPDAMGIVYVVNADQLLAPAFIDDLADIADFENRLFLVTQEDITADLQQTNVAVNLVETGTMNNTSFSAFSVTPK